ncbi:MAG: VOC family protein [Actinomycetia bacterium]|nr:VOC family protein [Actinomycetes bacterium]MCP4228356.1 VOC family protein [Actinomycetes bacterium]MCP5032978.1 VOC family protein [Actinomycetes bacterium]
MITHVETVAVYVSDQARARSFYVDQLGFELCKDKPFGPDEGGLRWIEVAPPGAETVLVLFTPPGLEDRIGRNSGLVFLCTDVEATARELKQRGVTFCQEPSLIPSGWWAQFEDPDGNQFGLSQAD